MIDYLRQLIAQYKHSQLRDVYLRRRALLTPHPTDHLAGGRMALVRAFHPHITFTRYSSARAELTPYHGLYNRAGPLIEAVGQAYTAIYTGEAATLADIPVDNHREPTLDYFLTTPDNRTLRPEAVFEPLTRWLFDIDDLIAEMESEDPTRYQYYTLRYNPLFSTALDVIDVLIAVSDLQLAPTSS